MKKKPEPLQTRQNRRTMIAFELFYKLALIVVFVPLITGCLNLSM